VVSLSINYKLVYRISYIVYSKENKRKKKVGGGGYPPPTYALGRNDNLAVISISFESRYEY